MFKQNKTKKFALSTLSLAALFAFGGNVAAEELYYDVYGHVHVSLDSQDSADNAEFHSNTSTFGVKGGQKLGSSDIEVIFKLEWQVDVTTRNNGSNADALVDRDQWVGFKGNFGKVIFGTATSNYKQMGGKIDPMYRTQLEARSKLMAIHARRLHAGAGIDQGRLTKSVNYATPKSDADGKTGFQGVINTTLSGSDDESFGVGARHTGKKHLVYIDYFSDGDSSAMNDGTGSSETAFKVGGYYKFGVWTVSGQFESSEDIDGSDYWMLGAQYKINDADTIKFSTGEADGAKESTSYAIMWDRKLGGMTNFYIGYGSKSDDLNSANDDDILTFGVRYRY